MSKSNSIASTLHSKARQATEKKLVEVLDKFARHTFDRYMGNDFKVKLTPIDESPATSKNSRRPLNLNEDETRELAL